uniref:Uncharacterized protein n=1 Tax=Tetranychus urticae TaxID=32264 RepID=T1KZJ5_TETUR
MFTINIIRDKDISIFGEQQKTQNSFEPHLHFDLCMKSR